MSPSIPLTHRSTTLVALSLALAGLAQSVAAQDCAFPTVPTTRVVTQPDGRALELRFRGTGFNHWYEDMQGFPVVQTEAGYFYARRTGEGRLAATEWSVGQHDPAQLGLERRVVPTPTRSPSAHGAASRNPISAAPGKRHAAAGNSLAPSPQGPLALGSGVDNLVLLLRFSDHGPSGQNRTLPSSTDVGDIMNAVGGDPILAPTGSVRDFYLENSYGAFTIDSTIVGWLTMPNSETYYANGNSGLTSLTWDLITDGLDAADALVDFSDFDVDGNGWVDAITFLHSGYGAEWGGTDQYGTHYSDRMWSHKWTIPTWTSAEGVKVGDYNISPGLWALSGSNPGRIGVVCHELGHFFGLPDLYDTDGGGEGIGNWCAMAAGAWGFDGSQQYPTHMSAWCKLKLGWAEPQRLFPGLHSALQAETDPAVYMIDSGYPQGEYLLIENRQQVGFDSVIPQAGLAVWHVDESKGSFTWNDPNTNEGYPGQSGWPGNNNHYRVALLQADGAYDLEQGNGRGDGDDVYRAGFATVIDTTTTPDSDAYQGGSIVVNSNRIDSIGSPAASMSFRYQNLAAPRITTLSLPSTKVGTPYTIVLKKTGGSAPFLWTEFLDAPSYTLNDLGPQTYTTGGTATGFTDDEGTYVVNLPFPFPYYETKYTRVNVTPNGTVDFAPLDNESWSTTPSLHCLPRIAGMWDDLTTDTGNIYLNTSVPGQVRIRWVGETWATGDPVNFAITLKSDGRIRFDYGSGNTNLSPTVGISRAHSGDLLLALTHDDEDTLTNANSLEFVLDGSGIPPGLTLSTGGVLSGITTQSGVYTFRVRVSDNVKRHHQRLYTLAVHDFGYSPKLGPP